ncbi:uncharacterized protein (UPF0332 family) [Azospirillum fermentarium]|uniref:hypothetical protein n=1 Tax=Azospirillum fermentarium TaxID=1233114 RepID=UPI002226A230|nr:hypothetical protein [Azospirillum fermentarium]MCW2244567.1 uncharacterized protein (UPF0332 family) [Azospirillum fermentarium]
MSQDWIRTARRLATATPNRPLQSDLRRAVSTAYYALFHTLARDAANRLVGAESKVPHSPAWVQVYRALDHGTARTACEQVRRQSFSPSLNACADAFVSLQKERHKADYDPDYRTSRPEALALVTQAESAITAFNAADATERRAFLVHLIFNRRR